MKLVHPELHFQIKFVEQEIPVCLVESPVRWREVQKELLAQYRGEEGDWILSEEDKEIKFSAFVEMIVNPLCLEENQKRIMNAFLRSFSEMANNEVYWKRSQELNGEIQKFFSDMEMEYPFEYHINSEIDFSALAKAMGIQIECEYENDLERLLQYCILTREIMKVKLFVFFNLHDYFTEDELKLFYQEIAVRKWNVLLLESTEKERISGEKYYIIDKDNCEIY